MCQMITEPTTTPEITTTTQLATTTPPALNLTEICYGVFFAARPHPYSSTHFIGCIRGEGTIHSCFTGEIFDADVLKCVPDICELPENICKGIQLEVIINPCSCYQYIVCYEENISVEGKCEENFIFDEKNKQ